MPSIRSVSVVIPVFNEEESLPQLLQELGAVADACSRMTWECIFVDDGSKDGSVEVLRAAAMRDRRIKLICFSRNFGQTAAMSCGITSAKGEVIVPMDADLQNNPRDIPAFLQRIEAGSDCVSGWRKERRDGFWLRRMPSWLANRLISLTTGVSLHDYGCSLKAYKKDFIQGVGLYGEMHRFIPAYIGWLGGRVEEMVVDHRPRIHGQSKYGLSRIPKVLLDLVVVKFLTKYFNKPMHFFGGVGILSFVVGLGVGMLALVLKVAYHVSFISTPLPMIGVLFFIVSVQLIMSGLIAEVLMRTYYESDRKKTDYSILTSINMEESVERATE